MTIWKLRSIKLKLRSMIVNYDICLLVKVNAIAHVHTLYRYNASRVASCTFIHSYIPYDFLRLSRSCFSLPLNFFKRTST